jgi:F-type H+-transporting ATPase subunit b
MSGLIDIRLVLTQILGFLILVWILGRYAWGPVVAQLEARRSRIAAEFEDAARRQREADALKAKYEQELKGIDSRARQRMLEAVTEGQRVAAEIKAQANADATARLARADEEIVHDQEKAREVLKQQVAVLSIRTAEKILRAKLDEPGQRALVERFIDEVDGRS